MADDRLADGKRIAQLLASELEGGGSSERLRVVDADPDVEATADGAFAYAVDTVDATESDAPADSDHGDHGDATENRTRLAEVYVQSDRARVEFIVGPAAAVDAAEDANLRVRPKAVRPPRTLVFVEDGAQVKWTLPVFEAVLGTR
ncbi:hypothetical protein [Haloprofundus salinisoli]|uniref:hypothetical protein n=1 Tax=Haloprofundus salinisoli TaxID=2876193 RepID=UPI001CCD9A7F|nr:hypothetical protein [Haloprofundus salinisoli]